MGGVRGKLGSEEKRGVGERGRWFGVGGEGPGGRG